MILTIRTDKPVSELGLYDGDEKLAYENWQAHRQLAETIHEKIKNLLESQGKTMDEITGIVVYKGPGSFTGLRIGMSVANALSGGLGVPIEASSGENWLADGLKLLTTKASRLPVAPDYGGPANVTQPRK